MPKILKFIETGEDHDHVIDTYDYFTIGLLALLTFTTISIIVILYKLLCKAKDIVQKKSL
jgi:hypothetical protein